MTTVSGAYFSIACIFLYMHVCVCVISPSCGDEEGVMMEDLGGGGEAKGWEEEHKIATFEDMTRCVLH